MRIRKMLTSLSSEEKRRFIEGMLWLKKSGRYDKFVVWHHHAMMRPAAINGEPANANYRNAAHRGPVFLPWHRYFLLKLEQALQLYDFGITIPYWDWTVDSELADPKAAPIWSEDFMGGDGNSQGIVETGAFAYQNGNWPLHLSNTGPELRRGLGRIDDKLPSKEDVNVIMLESLYDIFPYNSEPFTGGFRNKLEGWVPPEGDSKPPKLPRFTKQGRQLHNRVHRWVGGTMVEMVSPNDPVFFLHHAFIDKLWADWQAEMRKEDPENSPHYYPISGGPPGHNLRDPMFPWQDSPESVLNVEDLGYSYEQPIQPSHILMAETRAELRRVAHF
jgi:tyrosinase